MCGGIYFKVLQRKYWLDSAESWYLFEGFTKKILTGQSKKLGFIWRFYKENTDQAIYVCWYLFEALTKKILTGQRRLLVIIWSIAQLQFTMYKVLAGIYVKETTIKWTHRREQTDRQTDRQARNYIVVTRRNPFPAGCVKRGIIRIVLHTCQEVSLSHTRFLFSFVSDSLLV